MESPPPRGPGPVILATDVASLSATIARGPRLSVRAIVAIGRTAIRAVGPDTTGPDANDASRGRLENEAPALVPVVARVAEPAAASCSAAARDWRRLTRELRDLETSPSPETKVAASEVVGLGLVPGGCAACFADGTVEALVEDAVTFHKIASAEDRTLPRGALEAPAREKKHAEEKEQTAAFRRVVLRAGLAPFGGGVLAATSPVRDGEGEAAADGASLAPPPPPPRLKRAEARASEVFGADSPPESREADARFVSAEWWPFWSGARAAAAASVERAARLLARPSVSNVVFFTGAGASAESGMPAFRETVAGAADVDADGVRVGPATPLDALLPVWKTHDPEKYSTLSAFREDPTRCWFLHRKMFDQMRGLRPNDAHVAIGVQPIHRVEHLVQDLDAERVELLRHVHRQLTDVGVRVDVDLDQVVARVFDLRHGFSGEGGWRETRRRARSAISMRRPGNPGSGCGGRWPSLRGHTA